MVAEGAAANQAAEDAAESKMLYLGAEKTANQSGGAVEAEPTKTI